MSRHPSSNAPVSVSRLRDLPKEFLPEVAFAGRSNVGKSSLINSIIGRNVAPISQVPGKTRSIRWYECTLRRRTLGLVDLPGYGWAKLPVSVRQQWKDLVEGYLIHRKTLLGVVLVTDLRRGENDLDHQMASWLNSAGIRYLVVANKADKIKRMQLGTLLEGVARGTLVRSQDVVACSSPRGDGKHLVIRWLLELFTEENIDRNKGVSLQHTE